MYAPNPINQRIQSGDDEDEARYDAVTDDKAPIQESFLSFYNHNFQDLTPKSSLNPKSVDFACFNATSSNPFKFSYDSLIQDGFDLSSPKKKRKSDAVDGGAGGRVVRATGRKDRHSKVRTARGPRDRRVRLSPTTAIQFYDVQDRLGYDRPSKAIDWLINEAKTAIDALDQHQIKFSESNAAELSLSQTGMREKQEDSGFSCFVDEAAPSATALEAYLALDQYGFCSALNSTPQMFGGGGAEYSHINSQLPAAQPISDDANLIREPLQSSTIINNSSSINNYFAGFHFSNELSKIADSAIPSMKN